MQAALAENPARGDAQGMETRLDEQLVARFRSGADRDGAFFELFERWSPITYAFLRRRIGNADHAAELNQDLWTGILQGLDGFRGESSFKTWLFRLAHNRLSNLRRRWRTHLDELPDATPDDLVGDLVPTGGERPDEQLAREQASDRLETCLGGLPEVERAVIVGQYWNGETLEELTRKLHMTNKSGARASLIAAQRKLRRCLERHGLSAADAREAGGTGR